MEVIIFILIILIVSFVVGLIVFLRSLILRKNIGCGLFGLFAAILPVFLVWLFSYSLSYQSKSEFIRHFEWSINLTYPKSGKIVEKHFQDSFSFLWDYSCAVIIEMDTFDYEKILQEVQSRRCVLPTNSKRTSTHLLKKQFSENECAYFFNMGKRSLWFHKNRQILVYEIIDN